MVQVSTLEAYLQRFERLFDELELPSSPSGVLKAYRSGRNLLIGEEPGLLSVLHELFQFRNSLVHEIDWRVLGPPTLEDKLSLEQALDYGYSAGAAMRALEAHITAHAPQRFPNKLDDEGNPASKVRVLQDEIARLEIEIREKLKEAGDVEQWDRAVASSRENLEQELEFIFHSPFLKPNRYIDERENTRVRLYHGRLAYLEGLLSDVRERPEGELF
jgi:hypothetical protein